MCTRGILCRLLSRFARARRVVGVTSRRLASRESSETRAILFQERAFLERGVVGHKDCGEMVFSITKHAPPTPDERVGLFVWTRDMDGVQRYLVDAYDESTRRYTMVPSCDFYADDIRWTEAEIQAVRKWEVPLHDDRGRCSTFHDAIIRGHEACVRSLEPFGFERKTFVCMCASYGHLDLMRCLVVDFHWEMDADALLYASFRGQLQCLKFALENRCPMKSANLKKKWNQWLRDWDYYPPFDFLDDQDAWYKAECERHGRREPHGGFVVHQRCREFVTTLQSVDGFLRDVAPLLDYPEYSSQICERDKSVLRLMRSKFYIDYPYLEGRRARLLRMLRRSPPLRRKRTRRT